jgi:predicted GNAT family N-acyltransferase
MAAEAKTEYITKRFRPDSEPELFDTALAIRREVFVQEQNGSPDIEPDSQDPTATQWLLTTLNGEPVATGRLIPQGTIAKIGRIAVLKPYRGQGIAAVLMADIIDQAIQQGYQEAVLEAQTYATGLYTKFGFKSEGEPFLDEDNIEHIVMRKPLA